MKFYTQNGLERPTRLSESTRRFAYDSLNRVYGLDTLKNESVSIDDTEDINGLSDIERYDLCIRRIAEKAPIRICENEKNKRRGDIGVGDTTPEGQFFFGEKFLNILKSEH